MFNVTEALRQLPDEDEQGDADGVAMYAADDVEAGEDSDEEQGEEEAGGSGAGAGALVCPAQRSKCSANETVCHAECFTCTFQPGQAWPGRCCCYASRNLLLHAQSHR